MKKVMLIGSGGSGKSTLSRIIGDATGLPVYHLDALYWRPGWIPTSKDEWDELLRELMLSEEWIVDGNYNRTLDIRLEAADTVIYFDLSRWITTYRVIKRRIIYHGRTRPDLTEGCPERLNWEFIKWVWNFPRDSRPAIMEKLTHYSSTKRIIILKSIFDVKRFADQLKKEA